MFDLRNSRFTKNPNYSTPPAKKLIKENRFDNFVNHQLGGFFQHTPK